MLGTSVLFLLINKTQTFTAAIAIKAVGEVLEEDMHGTSLSAQ